MRQPAWIRHRVMRPPAPWQCWSLALPAVSILGTFVAGATLLLDGWFDALALYIACVLTLALLLNRVSNQQAPPQVGASANEGRADAGDGVPSLVLTRAPGAWAGTDRTAVTAALGTRPRD